MDFEYYRSITLRLIFNREFDNFTDIWEARIMVSVWTECYGQPEIENSSVSRVLEPGFDGINAIMFQG